MGNHTITLISYLKSINGIRLFDPADPSEMIEDTDLLFRKYAP